MALAEATPARSTGREAVDPRTACEPCWIRFARRTAATFVYDGTMYCRPCLALDGSRADEAETLLSNPVEKSEVHQPESEASMATPAQALATLKPRRGQRFCKCNCGEICGTKFGYVPGHGPVEAEPRKRKHTVRSVKPRKPKPTIETTKRADVIGDLIIATGIQHVDVRVSTAFLDRWFAQLPAAVKVEIFNRCQAE